MKVLKTKEIKVDKEDAINNSKLALISYIPLLAIIPYFKKTDSSFVEFHAKQGMTLLTFEIIFAIIYAIFVQIKETSCGWGSCVSHTPLYILIPLNIILTFYVALIIIGIMNVVEKKAKQLPLIGNIELFK